MMSTRFYAIASAKTTDGLATSPSASYTASSAPCSFTTAQGELPGHAGSDLPLRMAVAVASSAITLVIERSAVIGSSSFTCSGASASCSVKSPMEVRRRLRKCAPPPSSVPKSAASVRTYVPDEQRTSMRTTSGSCVGSTSYEYTVTGRALRSTTTPSRASSCKRLPSTRSAETIGEQTSRNFDALFAGVLA